MPQKRTVRDLALYVSLAAIYRQRGASLPLPSWTMFISSPSSIS